MTLPRTMMTPKGKMSMILCEVGHLLLMWILDAMDGLSPFLYVSIFARFWVVHQVPLKGDKLLVLTRLKIWSGLKFMRGRHRASVLLFNCCIIITK